MRFRIDLKIFLFIILFCLTNQIEIYAMIMVFAIIHEFGHLLAGICIGMRAEKLEIMPFGVRVSFKMVPKDYNKKIKKGNLLEIKNIGNIGRPANKFYYYNNLLLFKYRL